MIRGLDGSGATLLAQAFSGAGVEPLAELEKMAQQLTFGAGDTLYAPNQPGRIGIVVTGVLRSVLPLRNGRRATLDYIRPGSVFGLPTLFSVVQLRVEAVRRSEVIDLDPQTVARVARTFPRFGWSISQHLAGAVHRFPENIEEFSSMTVRDRLGRHLLELSIRDGSDGGLVVHQTQEALADSVGSVREVVSRCLRSLRDEGLIEVAQNSIKVLDPNRLRSVSD